MSTRDPASMQIGEVAERTALSLRTLRHYDEIGLVSPSARSAGGFRLYTEDDIELLLLIRRMKPLGYSLDDMHHVIGLLHESGRPDRGAWAEVIAEAQRRRENLARQVEMADEFVALLNARFGGAPA